MTERHAYGGDPSQFGELTVPAGDRRGGVVVLIHGGFWRAAYGLDGVAQLVPSLTAAGWAVWSLEYRRVGIGGGWPQTFADVATGLDLLGELLPGEPCVVVGHSAGGQLAAWTVARPGLDADAVGSAGDGGGAPVGAVSLAGVLDLRHAALTGVGAGAVEDVLGGAPGEVGQQYRAVSPIERLPVGVPVLAVHGRADANVPFDQSTRYVEAARAAGDPAELIEVAGDHFTVVDPGSAAWATALARLPGLFGA